VRDHGPQGYRVVFADPVAGRLWIAATVSYLGDFIGLGALLLTAYTRSGGHPLGPAAVFGVQALPAFAASAGMGPWLDRIPRRAGMLTLCLTGAAAMAVPIVFGGLWPVLATAAVIGAVRTVFNAIRTGSIADGVPRDIRARLVALVSMSNQVSEVLGYLTGAGVAIAIGAGPALAADAATFIAAAALIAGIRLPPPAQARQRASMTTGIRTIMGDQTLSVLAPVVWIGLALCAMPQTLAATALSKTDRSWVPAALAAMAAGAAISAILVGRSSLGEKVRSQLRYVTGFGVMFLLTAAALKADPLLLVAGNFAIGLFSGWTVSAQTTFIHVVPPERMAHVTGTMIGSLIVLEGTGAVIFGAIAGAFGVPAAYLAAGVLLTVAGLAGQGYVRLHPKVRDLRRAPASRPSTAGAARNG
jgi:MFS family permease